MSLRVTASLGVATREGAESFAEFFARADSALYRAKHEGRDCIRFAGTDVAALAPEGRLVIIGMQGGTRAELDINALLRKRGAVIATALRSRPAAEKAAICASVVEHVWPLVAEGLVQPVVHGTMPLAEVAAAHALMESGAHSGKILLTV